MMSGLYENVNKDESMIFWLYNILENIHIHI